MLNEKQYYLAKVDLLADLNTQELSELALDCHWEEFAPGSLIIKHGQDKHFFYVLVEGKAEVLRGSNTLPVRSFVAGEAFGEISIFTGKKARTSVRAVETCRVLSMDAEHFTTMLARWPKLYKRFIEQMSQTLIKANMGLWEAKHKEFLLTALQQTQYETKYYGIWGSPRTTNEVETNLSLLAKKESHLFLIGERGTGRQMFAWYLHKSRFGDSAPFVVVEGRQFDQQWGNVMFEESAQEDAPSNIKGGTLIDVVRGGTLVIRDINHISPKAQLMLSQALEKHRKDCLVIATLVVEPEQLGTQVTPELMRCFTERYKILPIRERKRDIAYIAQGILEKLATQNNRPVPSLDTEATKLLLSHTYRQGNVSELIQVVERSFFLAENNVIGLEHVFFGPTAEKIGRSIDLLQWDWIERLLKKGSFVTWMQRIFSVTFLCMILFLLVSPRVAIATGVFALVWGLWWPALAIISPSLGRLWCTVCPFSFVMNLFQQRWGRHLNVPDVLKKYDYLIISVMFMLILWTEASSGMRANPIYTGILLMSILVFAILTGLIFSRHTWCRHLCPLGGFVGMASIGGMVEVRADGSVCLNKCTTHECYKGTKEVSGCPMSQHAQFLDNNLGCKLCFHCVRNCPHKAIKVNVRIPAREVWHLVRVDQGFTVFIGVAFGIVFPINYFEPLYSSWPRTDWLIWFSIFFCGSGVVGGTLAWLIARPFKTKGASHRVKMVFALIPLVLGGYIIYQLHFIPGISTLMLGVGFKDSAGATIASFVPAFAIGVGIAITTGVLLTSFTMIMVFLRSKGKQRLEKPIATIFEGGSSEKK